MKKNNDDVKLIGVEWKDTRNNKYYCVTSVNEDTLHYSYSEKSRHLGVCGGCHEIKDWHKKVKSGMYVITMNLKG